MFLTVPVFVPVRGEHLKANLSHCVREIACCASQRGIFARFYFFSALARRLSQLLPLLVLQDRIRVVQIG